MITTMVDKIKQNPMISSFLLVAAVLGGIVKIVDFGAVYDKAGLPRWAWQSDLEAIKEKVISLEQSLIVLEIDYRQNQLRMDQRLLRETTEQITQAERLRQPGAVGLAEFQSVLQLSISEHQARLNWLLEKRAAQ